MSRLKLNAWASTHLRRNFRKWWMARMLTRRSVTEKDLRKVLVSSDTPAHSAEAESPHFIGWFSFHNKCKTLNRSNMNCHLIETYTNVKRKFMYFICLDAIARKLSIECREVEVFDLCSHSFESSLVPILNGCRPRRWNADCAPSIETRKKSDGARARLKTTNSFNR